MLSLICYSLGIDYMFDFMNQNNEPQNNPNFGLSGNNNPSSHNNGGPQLPQNNNQFFHNTQTQDDENGSNHFNHPRPEYNEQAAREYMVKRLQDHRSYCRMNKLSQTNKLDYAPLSKKFNSSEHEFICEKIENHFRVHPVPGGGLNKYVLGDMPFRHYNGPVCKKIIQIVANSRD